MQRFPTAQEAGLKILDHDDADLAHWLVLHTVSPRDSLVDRANYDTLKLEVIAIGDDCAEVSIPTGLALLVGPEAINSMIAAEEMLPQIKKGRILMQADYDNLLRQVTEACWEEMGVARRLTLCQLVGADPTQALLDDPPVAGTLRTLAENEAMDWVFAPETAAA
jgi:hypothetical protein